MNADRIRTTISLDPEVHEIFKRMAEASGMSVSRCMGEWLADTAEGAQFVSLKMQEARQAPMSVMREFQALAEGFSTDVNETMQTMRKVKVGAVVSRSDPTRRTAATRKTAPSSNTGLKSPGKGKNNKVKS
jgi:predicted transcriptional regulator